MPLAELIHFQLPLAPMFDNGRGIGLPQEQGLDYPNGLVVLLLNEGEGDSV